MNGVNRLATKGEKTSDYRQNKKKITTDYRQKKKLTDYRHGPPLSIFVYQKSILYFSSLRSNHIKGNYRISCHLLTFWPEERGSFCRTISGTRAHETSRCNISTKSRSQQDKDAYREVCNNYSMSLKNVKQRYYSDLIEECGGDTRKLFQAVRSLSNKPEEIYSLPMMIPAS